MIENVIFQIKVKQGDYVSTGVRFHSGVFFYGGQSRVKSNTEINNSEGILKLFPILEMSFLKLPRASKYPRTFIKSEGNWMKLSITLTKILRQKS